MSNHPKSKRARMRVPKPPLPTGAFLVQTREIVTRTYRVPADSEQDARVRFDRGEYHRFVDNDVQVDEVLSIERES